MSTTETPQEAVKPVLDIEAVRAFELDRDESVMFYCPDCEEPFWLHQDEGVVTLGDIIDTVAAHECLGYDPSGEAEPTS